MNAIKRGYMVSVAASIIIIAIGIFLSFTEDRYQFYFTGRGGHKMTNYLNGPMTIAVGIIFLLFISYFYWDAKRENKKR
jgi:hypothetical protein